MADNQTPVVATSTPAKGKGKGKGKGKPPPVVEERKMEYPEENPVLFKGENGLTAEKAKELLGWKVVATKSDAVLLNDRFGSMVVCENNVRNRPLYRERYEAYVQEILTKHWAGPNGDGVDTTNGEPIIIGQYEAVLNGQHQLLAVILAEQDRQQALAGKGTEGWRAGVIKSWGNTPVRIDKWVLFGISEDDRVVNTMDTCKPRSLADVIYRSEFFASSSKQVRQAAARDMDYAIRLLWARTGSDIDAFAPRRTHSEAIDMIHAHPRLVQAIKHIQEENRHEPSAPAPISNWISCGYAAGLLYLMAASGSDSEKYYEAENPSEKELDLDKDTPLYMFDSNNNMVNAPMWHRACEFWRLFGLGGEVFKPVRHALGMCNSPDNGMGGTFREKVAVLLKAWNMFVSGEEFDEDELAPDYATTKDDKRILVDKTLVGGIDLGWSVKRKGKGSIGESEQDSDPTPERIAAEAEQIRASELERMRKGNLSDAEAFSDEEQGGTDDDAPLDGEGEEDVQEDEQHVTQHATPATGNVAADRHGWTPPPVHKGK